MNSLAQKLAAELIGTAFLLAIVIGSGVMGEQLSGGNIAIALLANALATGAGLLTLILMFGPISGAHFNPVVTAASAWGGDLSARHAVLYVGAQLAGAFLGVMAAHAMFALPLLSAAQHVRSGGAQFFSEIIATFGLLCVIKSTVKNSPERTPMAVAAYITAAYWFTASTSFANPAVTVARAFSNTFAGIRLMDVPCFVAAQIIGAAAAVFFMQWLLKSGVEKTTEKNNAVKSES